MASTSAPVRRPAATATKLTEADVPTLRLPGRRNNEVMRDTLRDHPGRSTWMPGTLEYLLIGSWRNRPEISSIEDVNAVRHLEPLVQRAIAQCHDCGDDLLVALELESHRGKSRFERAGLAPLEEVITYEIEPGRVLRTPARMVSVEHVYAEDLHWMPSLIRLDNAAFPWLWRNTRAEFLEYLTTPGVSLLALHDSGQLLAYIGVTAFDGWGHVDRVAVSPELQGHGYGAAAVLNGLELLRRSGARRVGLSTQRTNVRSQRLYERMGFERTPDLDYYLYGAWTATLPATR
ncbi:MAG: GNAT family N-acetyltransferase [Thermomicrobiales bacterium]